MRRFIFPTQASHDRNYRSRDGSRRELAFVKNIPLKHLGRVGICSIVPEFSVTQAATPQSSKPGRTSVAESRVTVILVSHDSERVIAEALDSIPSSQCTIICVDNDSTDRTREIVSRYPARLVGNDNIGFGAACNLGAGMAETEFLLFLNPDARLASDAVDRLVEAADRYADACAFSPRIEDDNGGLQFREASRIERWREPRRSSQPIAPIGDCCTGFVEGSILFVRREFFLSLGGFDPNIFLYYEDDDLSFRMRKCKAPMIHVNAARARHMVSTSSIPNRSILMRRAQARKISEYYVKAKYGKRSYRLLDGLRHLVSAAWYGLTLNRARFTIAAGRLKGIAGVSLSLGASPSDRVDAAENSADRRSST